MVGQSWTANIKESHQVGPSNEEKKKRISSLYSEISSTTQTPQFHSWADLGASLFSELRGLVMGKDHWGRIKKGRDVIKHLHKLWYNLTPWSYQLVQWPRDGVISQPVSVCLCITHCIIKGQLPLRTATITGPVIIKTQAHMKPQIPFSIPTNHHNADELTQRPCGTIAYDKPEIVKKRSHGEWIKGENKTLSGETERA